CRVPQDRHCHVLVDRISTASKCPHELHVLELGYHLSITIRCRPALDALYSTMRRKAPQPQSEMALASDRLRTMFFTARSSITITIMVADQPGRGAVQEVLPGGADLAV